MGCPSSTERAVYIRLNDSGKYYEAWGHDDGSTKTIYAATDENAQKATLFFQSESTNVFSVAAILNGFVTADAPSGLTYAISGGADLTSGSGVLDIQLLVNSSSTALSVSGGTYDADSAGPVTTDKRHCYTSLATAAVTTTASTCSGLFGGPSTAYLRGSSQSISNWSVADIGSDAIATTF